MTDAPPDNQEPGMPFTAVQQQMAELTAEVHTFNEEAPKLREDVKKLTRRGAVAITALVLGFVAMVVAVIVAFVAIDNAQQTAEDAKQDRLVAAYQGCLRGNNLREGTLSGFEITFDSIVGPEPGPEASQDEIDRYNRNSAQADEILKKINDGPAFDPVDCGTPPG